MRRGAYRLRRYSRKQRRKGGGILKKLKGYTLTETVIAIALAVLVTAASTTAIITTINSTERLNRSQAAVREVENILVCAQSDDISQGLTLLYGENAASDDDGDLGNGFTVYFDKSNKHTTDKDNAFWKVECKITLIDATEDGQAVNYYAGMYDITLKASEVEKEDVLYELSYKKAK